MDLEQETTQLINLVRVLISHKYQQTTNF